MESEQEETKFPEGFSALHSTLIAIGFGMLLLVILMAGVTANYAGPVDRRFWLGAIILWTGLTALTWYDCHEFRLPDLITLSLICTGLIVAFAKVPSALILHGLGAVFGYGLIWLLGFVFFRIRKTPGIGMGDAKLFAAAGAWCGAYALPFVMLVASGTGLLMTVLSIVFGGFVTNSASRYIPFGPFLGLGIWIFYIFQGVLSF